MIRIAIVVAMLVSVLGVVVAPGRAQEVPSTVISGGDLAHPVRLSRTDDDDFRRRLSLPPVLDVAPVVGRDLYQVTSPYWDEVIRLGRTDVAAVEATADYHEDEGFVRARQGQEDVWLVLDLRQRAILDRYLRLARTGRLPERPGVLQVLAQAWRSEVISVEVEGDLLSPVQKNIFFTGVNIGEQPTLPREPISLAERRGIWIVFGLEEGRSVRLFYDPAAQEFIDAFGSEVYKVHEQTALSIAAANAPGRGPQVEQEQGPGSPIWWGIMLGAGVGALGVAALVRRRGAESTLTRGPSPRGRGE